MRSIRKTEHQLRWACKLQIYSVAYRHRKRREDAVESFPDRAEGSVQCTETKERLEFFQDHFFVNKHCERKCK